MTDPLLARLRAAGCVYAEDEARLLRSAASSEAELDRLASERVSGRPLEQVLGWAEFSGLRIAVEPGVFVPRRRSEVLVAVALDLLRPLDRRATVLDLCCGTGAIGAAIASRRPIELHAADCDPVAAACAARNVAAYDGIVHVGDLYAGLPDGLRGRVGLIVANAPYVPSDKLDLMPAEAREHEPRAALDGGPDGTATQHRIARSATDWLSDTGCLLIETSERQAPLTVAAVTAGGLTATVRHDDDVEGTAVLGTCPRR